MSLSQPGSAAGGAVDAPRRPQPTVPQPTVPQPTDGDDHLLEAVRRGLEPGDPVAHLLAGWVALPALAVCTTRVRAAGTATTRTAGTPMG
jgi:hypothetical protein